MSEAIKLLVAVWIGFFLGWLGCTMTVISHRQTALRRGRGITREVGSYEVMETRRRAEARDGK